MASLIAMYGDEDDLKQGRIEPPKGERGHVTMYIRNMHVERNSNEATGF